MRRNFYATLTFIVCIAVSYNLVATAATAVGSIAYVYRIKSDNCTHEPVSRRQTGFRVQGITGIVTALHGVADCKTISALSDDGQEIYLDLSIQQIDITHDAALLSSTMIDDLPNAGLIVSPVINSEILDSCEFMN